MAAALADDLAQATRRLGRDPQPADHGLLSLLVGDADRAVHQFELAVAHYEGADSLSDLSAGYLARAQSSGNPMDLLLALGAAHRAVEADPVHATGVFNYAAALSRVHLRESADRAWRRFLEIEGTGAWAQEARQQRLLLSDNRSRLEWATARNALLDRVELTDHWVAGIVAGHAYETRKLCELEIPQRWAEASLEPDRELADFWLRRWFQIAGPLAREHNEWLAWDEAERLRALPLNDQGGEFLGQENAQMWLRLASAQADYEQLRFNSASELLRPLLPSLSRVQSPFAHLAELYIAVGSYYASVPGVASQLEELVGRIPDRYPSILGRTQWMLGIAAATQRRFETAIQHYSASLVLISKSSGAVRAATLRLLIADSLDSRGEILRGWQHRIQALETLGRLGEPRRRFGALIDTTQALARHGRPSLALVFLQEAESTLKEYVAPAGGAELHLERSRILLEQRDTKAARSELSKASSYVEQLEAGGLKQRLTANLTLLRAIARTDTDPAGAAASMRRAYATHLESGYRFGELAYLSSLARAQLASGSREQAASTLEKAILTYEETHRETVDLGSKIETARQADSVFRQLVHLSLSPPDPDPLEAFRWLERSRARTLRSVRSAERQIPGSATIDQIVQGMRAGTVLVEYAVSGDDLLAWTVSPNHVGFHRLESAGAELERRVGLFLQEIQSASHGEEHSRLLATRLHEALIAPLELDLQAADRLVIVPDGPLWRLPFSALIDSTTGRYLVEQIAVLTAPSAKLLLGEDQPIAWDQDHLQPLVVASRGPTTGPYRFLPRLSFVEREVVDVTSSIAGATALLGPEVTVDNLMGLLPKHNLLYFAGHAISSGSTWQASGLILNPSERRPDGFLDGASITGLNLSHVDLVVLAGCQTLTGYDGGSEGTISLGLAFYLAGAARVGMSQSLLN